MEKSNRAKKSISKILLIILMVFTMSAFFELSAKNVSAQFINVSDVGTQGKIDANTAGDEGAFSWTKAWEKLMDNRKEIAGVAFKRAVGAFLNKIAYDTATYLATGDEGQKPMFYTEGWGKYLQNVADNAAGTFLEELGRNPYLQFNLCEPDFNMKVKIGLGLQREFKPKAPACTFSEMKRNWQQELDNPNFLYRFQDMFNANSNDLSIAMKVRTGMENEVSKALNEAVRERVEGEGFRAVTEKISGYIKSPAKSVVEAHGRLYTDETKKELTWTGTAADAIDTFINTLVSKLMKKLLQDGLVSKFPDNSYQGNWGDFSDIDASPYASGVKGAKERFKKIIEPEFGVRGDYNILGELTACPDPAKAGPTNCVITDKFSEAVNNKMTVGQAMREGYLNPSGIFGFTADGLEPSHMEGYPYRSMIILRKFRIIPAGWEVAAQFIKDKPQEVSMGGSGGTRNLEDLVNCFVDNDEYGDVTDTLPWCRGLVDPNWVLKAPLNYCKKEGPGPEILSERITGTEENSKRLVTRNDNYCADEQTCIKENSDGSCMLYGYCTEERRKWDYGAESCDPVNNTCLTFRSRDGQTLSFLENTLDYGTCSIANAGCKSYCEDFDFSANDYTCSSLGGDRLYADKDIGSCDINSEGCHEFIRTKAGTGANLLKNSSFETIAALDLVDDGIIDSFDYWGAIGEAVGDSFIGFSSAQLNADLSHTVTIDPPGYNLSLEDFTLSFYAKDCGTAGTFTLGGLNADMGDFSDGRWKYLTLSYAYPNTVEDQVSFTISPDGACKIDAIKLERGSRSTAYAEYRNRGLFYQKLAPEYLGCNGVSDPSECDDFARRCDVNEVGCDLYTSATDGMSVPGKIAPLDQCPGACVGYDAYLQSDTYFDSARLDNFIPNTARSCSAEKNGCDEFTNLDRLGEGAEAREYYSQLRQCTRPNDPASSCSEFYTWEGSAETGYQLRVFVLNQDIADINGNGISDEPQVTTDDSLDCNASVYGYSPSNPLYNPDCREFYNTSGEISYHLYSLTVTCSDNCHPYRRTDVNIDPATGLPNCKNGGLWNVEHGACIYMAIPGEGKKCSASQAGCREYSGNSGNNIRMLFTNDFEGSLQGWYGLGGTSLSLSSNSLIAGGESLEVLGGSFSMALDIGGLVREGNAYALQFLANAPVDLTARIENSVSSAGFSGTASVNAGEWDVYELNLPELDHAVQTDERLVITATGSFNIDDIRLIEIIDRYYLIKNSWQTPEVCEEDIFGNYQGPNFNLGCDEYYDRAGDTYYLHDFTKLCSESAVGCELMIDTHNYSNYNGATFNAGDDSEEVVPADSYAYVVYDPDKLCNSANKGCQRLGEEYQYGSDYLYGDIYLKNDPDSYDEILCMENEKNCESWSSSDGTAYFKDPGDMTCDYRQEEGAGESWKWYKRKVKRCDDGSDGGVAMNGLIEAEVDAFGNLYPLEANLCQQDTDCISDRECIVDENNYACPVAASPAKTIGFGGAGNIVYQPMRDNEDNNWAGICPPSQSGCTEFIDPVATFNSNHVFNHNFSDIDGDGNFSDGWTGSGPWSQEIFDLKPLTLYKLGGQDSSGAVLTLTCSGNIRMLDGNNEMLPPPTPNSITMALGPDPANRLFYSNANTSCTVQTTSMDASIELRQAVLAYHLKDNVDRETCNGQVDFDEGCVLFNQRSVTGGIASTYDYSPLVFNAAGTKDDGPADSCTGDDCDSNVLLKVSPDRECSEWLACRSMAQDEKGANICLDIGLCNNVDSNGVCNQFVIEDYNVRDIAVPGLDAPKISNSTGYSKVGMQWVNDPSMRAQYPLGSMDQIGSTLMLTNGNFEIIGDNKYPIGWLMESQDRAWKPSYFSIIDNPVSAQQSGAGAAAEGRAFLKAGEVTRVISEYIDIEPANEYIFSAKISTIALSLADANVALQTYNSDGAPVGTPVTLTLEAGHSWQFKQKSFTAVSNATKARIILSTMGTGNYFVDDIKVKPALEIRSGEYVLQTCRLYPDDDSLSCDYFEDSGIRKKGWWGYCLEYDRYPGNQDACLMWWPIDRAAGNGLGDLDMFSGYSGKYPVYYCDHIEASFEFVEHREEKLISYYEDEGWAGWFNFLLLGLPEWISPGDESSEGAGNVCPATDWGIENGGYQIRTVVHESSSHWGLKEKVEIWHYCQPIPGDRVVGNWYTYNGNLVKYDGLDYGGWDERPDGVKIYDPSIDAGPMNPKNYNIKCYKIWQTVNSIGTNKAWLGRVHEGSDYKIHVLDYTYESDDPPFGSAVPPEPVNNPYEWDGAPEKGIQPLYYLEKSGDQARAGSPYECHADNGFNKCPSLGYCDVSGDVCINVPQSAPTGMVYCPLKTNDPACYTHWDQTFLECPQGERCLPKLNNLDLVAPPATPENNLKRIFAESYGAWEWLANEGKCAGGSNAGAPCDYNGNQCPGGYCQSRCEMSLQVGGKDVGVANTDPATGDPIIYPTCSGPGDASCNGILYDGLTAAQLTAANSCQNAFTVCGGAGAPDCLAKLCDPSEPDFAECSNYCINLCSPDQFICSDTYHLCDPAIANECSFNASCAYDECEGGTSDGNKCSAEHICNGSYCILETFAAGRYKPVNEGWDVPDRLCFDTNDDGILGPRPAWGPSGKCWSNKTAGDCFACDPFTQWCDYCAVLPQIYNIRVDGNPGKEPDPHVKFTENKMVNLTFNSSVDLNQTPLVGYYVDWGDGERTAVTGIEMYSKPKTTAPHSLYHIYDYWGLRKRFVEGDVKEIDCGSAGDNLPSVGPAPQNYCRVRPSVKVKDNWGYCNNGCDMSTAVCTSGPCPAGGYLEWGSEHDELPFVIVYEK